MNFAKNIKFLRKQHGLTQEDLAGELGVTRPVVGSWEEGRVEASFGILIKIKNRFNITIDDLLLSSIERTRKGAYKNDSDIKKQEGYFN